MTDTILLIAVPDHAIAPVAEAVAASALPATVRMGSKGPVVADLQRRLAAEVGIEHGGVLADVAGRDQVDQPGHRLPLVDGVDDHALEPAGELDGVDRRLDRDAVPVTGPALEHGDLVVAQVASEADQVGCVARDPAHLGAGLVEGRGGVDADDPAGAAAGLLEGREAGDHARVRGAGHRAHDDGVEEDVELLLLLREWYMHPNGQMPAYEFAFGDVNPPPSPAGLPRRLGPPAASAAG